MILPHEKIFNLLRQIFPDFKIVQASESGKFFSPFIIRMHGKGTSIPLHKDNVCYEGKEYYISNSDAQLSCILHLQGTEAGGDLVVYNKNWKKCDEKYRQIDFGYCEKLVSSDQSSVISNIEPGDLVLINPLHYHKVTTILGSTPRITLGMFIGFFRSQKQIVSWA
jgi:hypothetical protein